MWIFDSTYFILELPNNWSQYDDGEEETSAFFNTEKWSGNLRITPVKIKENISEILKSRRYQNSFKINDLECIYYKEINELDYINYYWEFGRNNLYVICSFTFNIELFSNENQDKEIQIVENIIKTFKFKTKDICP